MLGYQQLKVISVQKFYFCLSRNLSSLDHVYICNLSKSRSLFLWDFADKYKSASKVHLKTMKKHFLFLSLMPFRTSLFLILN